VIFVTTGSLFPFDRLIRAADELAPQMPGQTFFAQVGESAYRPRNMEFARLLPRQDFMARTREADLMVAHAGMGSTLTAMELGKPIVLVPRRLDLGEHNTDHQMATARWLQDRGGVHVCFDDADLGDVIRAAVAGGGPGDRMSRTAPEPFLRKIRDMLARA
jgi:UDP-N-acetylglucosamine transferase subunit ALG13